MGDGWSNSPIVFENALNISLAVQNTNDAKSVLVRKVVNPDSFKSGTGHERRPSNCGLPEQMRGPTKGC